MSAIPFDIGIVGSGFGGSLMAMAARKLGYSVVLLERGKHPRFTIGESSTPLANLLLEEFAREYDLPQLSPLTKWGTWQEHYPKIGCGLKRGFTFLKHEWNQPFSANPDRSNQLLVAASPHDRIADTHWHRPDFDAFLVDEAIEEGAVYFDEIALDRPVFDSDGVRLTGIRETEPYSFQCQFLVDASGPRGFLHRHLGLDETQLPNLPGTQALFSHFTHVKRLADSALLGVEETPPYPPDAAATHHVFDGGWIWVLHLNNGITSAGVAATDSVAARFKFNEGQSAWHRLLNSLPSVQKLFADARPLYPFIHIPRIGFQSGRVAGERWALLPSAAGFIDPLLSTGFTLNLFGIFRLGRWLKTRGTSGSWTPAEDYASDTMADLLAAAQMVAALYASMKHFRMFTSLSLLYFAAVSFAETARRLGRSELAPSFLLRTHPVFAARVRACCQKAIKLGRNDVLPPGELEKLEQEIAETIEPFDIAGLRNPARRNWHPVDAADLFAAIDKLQATRPEIEALLRRCGFAPIPPEAAAAAAIGHSP
jgi:FADH2 O2-dependent halogenase